MRKEKIALLFSLVIIASVTMGATCRPYFTSYSATMRAILKSTQLTIRSMEELYVTYYDTTYKTNLDLLEAGTIDKEEYLKRKAELEKLEKKVTPIFIKAKSIQNAAVTLLGMIEQGIKDKKEGKPELEKYVIELQTLILEINEVLIEFEVIPKVGGIE